MCQRTLAIEGENELAIMIYQGGRFRKRWELKAGPL